METKVKRREWVKTAAIVFLSVLLVLTFFSNTIMNRSLPEVAAKYVESGAINAKIRGSGTVAANEVYEVSLAQTRKIRSVLVKVGQEVTAGDPLFQLESMESEELKMAQEQLASMELNYQKRLIEASNSSAMEDRGIQKLREAYDEALRIYRIYSNVNPDQIQIALKEAESGLSMLQSEQTKLNTQLSQANNALQKAQADEANFLARLGELETEIDTYNMKLDGMEAALTQLNYDKRTHETRYNELEAHALTADPAAAADRMAAYAQDPTGLPEATAYAMVTAYNVLETDLSALTHWLDKQPALEGESNFARKYDAVISAYESEETVTKQNRLLAQREHETISQSLSVNNPASSAALAVQVENLEAMAARLEQSLAAQQEIVSDYQQAANAAQTLKSAEEALEDAVFEASLGDSGSLDMQAEKDAIEEQKKLIDELTVEADGQEIVANVSGVISSIAVTAGSTAGAEQPIAEITVADRGYTVSVTVTAEQARQVRVGDMAEITNYYWGGITATLENIANDPQSMGQNKVLIFRIDGEDLEPGTNLSLSIGQKSANYDCLVPNSAIRSDSNGSFVLVVVAKSSPLGNRYVATRADVKVLASDDTMSAVSGLSYGDFVITTSNKPLEAGDLVRLPDNG